MKRYERWYRGEISLYDYPPPTPEQRIVSSSNQKRNAAITWSKICQEKIYLDKLAIGRDVFRGKRICHVGCGPHPGALCFIDCEIYGIDPSISAYKKIGYPVEDSDRYHFIQTKVERTPFPEGYFDAVISVNAIDHIDNLGEAAQEIRRVLHKNGLFRMHVNYHSPTIAEPHSLSDETFKLLFSRVPNLFKVSDSRPTFSDDDVVHALWSNF
jgi:SAM-dependent methyltransferase